MKYWDEEAQQFIPIPRSLYYVLATAVFLERGKKVVHVVPCDSEKIAYKVDKYMKCLGNLKHVRIMVNPPRNYKDVIYLLQPKWIQKAIDLDKLI